MPYITPETLLFTIDGGYTPPSPFVLVVDNNTILGGDGVAVEPSGEVSASGNSILPTSYGAGVYTPVADGVTGNASSIFSMGRITPHRDDVSGAAETATVAWGMVIDGRGRVSGLAYSGEIVYAGSMSPLADSIHGAGSTGVYAWGRVSERPHAIDGGGAATLIASGSAAISEPVGVISGACHLLSICHGSVTQVGGSVSGYGYIPAICTGAVSQGVGIVSGTSIKPLSLSVLQFSRSSVVAPTIPSPALQDDWVLEYMRE